MKHNLTMSTVYLSLGSNIDAEENLKAAATMLRAFFPDIRFSSVYRTEAQNYEDQADFLNAVASFHTGKSPATILTILQGIETMLWKDPPFRFGPRTIDLDILLYGDEMIHTHDLKIPHPRMHERRFVLEPLSELIDLSATHPLLKKSWKEFRKTMADQEICKTSLNL